MVLTVLACFFATGLFAQAPYADFSNSFSPALPVEVNDQFTMTVAVETSSPVSVAEVHLTFDPAYLEVVSITPITSSLDESIVPTAFDNTAGTIDYAAFTTAMPAPNSNFDLVSITFKALQLTAGTSIDHVTAGFPVSIIAYAGDEVLDVANSSSIEIECLDTDDDGLCDTADPDDDNDGCEDQIDTAPLTASSDGDNDTFGADCDCNDGNDSVYPGAPEICDDLDNDCDGNIDTADPDYIDNTAPVPDVASLPDITAECEVTSLTAPTATDACEGTITGTTDATLPIDVQGTTTITWTYDDGNGNLSTQTQDIEIDDETPPADPGLVTLTDQCGITATPPSVLDVCAGEITASTIPPNEDLVYNDQGTYTITWLFDDGNGNSITRDQQIIIDDTEAPEVFECPGDILVNVDPGECFAVVDYDIPMFSDNCLGPASEGDLTSGLAPNSEFPVGETDVVYTFTDEGGNSDTCEFKVTVTDNEAPITPAAPVDIQVSCITAVPAAPELTANDNCAGVITVPPVDTDNGGSGCNGDPLIITRTWTFDDGNDNIVSIDQEITVIDDVAPSTPAAEAPETYTCLDAVPAPGQRTATDNCSDDITVTGVDSDNGGSGCVGDPLIITRTWTFTDDCGNTSTLNKTIEVVDDEAPSLASGPLNLNVQCEAPPVYANYAEFQGVGGEFTDNCSLDESSFSHVEDEVVNDGSQVNRTYEISDDCGNVQEFIQTIIIEDTEDPSISCASDDSRAINTTNGTYVVNGNEFDPASASDICTDSNELIVTHNAGDIAGASGTGDNTTLAGWELPEGVHTITWTVEDEAGNTAECEVQITVVSQELSGTVDIINTCLPLDVRVGVFDGSGNQVGGSFVSSLDGSGNFTLGLSGVPAGTYDVKVKVETYLEQEVTGVSLSGSSSLPATLTNWIPGDIASNEADDFEDNYIGAHDLSLLINHYNTVSGDPNFLDRADLNCNGIIDALDLSILLYYYNTPPSGGGS